MYDADPVELRVLGCLIEKQRTTPDAYPLSLNALRLACNQATNRDPVVEYDEPQIKAALERLGRREWTRLASGATSRAAKYRHLLDEALHLSGPELALLAVLMLRGSQTPGELKARTERLHRFGSVDDVEATLGELGTRRLVERQPRRPGQKEERWTQRLGGAAARDVEHAPAAGRTPAASEHLASARTPGRLVSELEVEERLAALELEVDALRAELSELRRLLR